MAATFGLLIKDLPMAKTEERELTKHTMMFYEGDLDKLRAFYPDIGAGAIVRRLVQKYIEQIEAQGGVLDAKVEIKI